MRGADRALATLQLSGRKGPLGRKHYVVKAEQKGQSRCTGDALGRTEPGSSEKNSSSRNNPQESSLYFGLLYIYLSLLFLKRSRVVESGEFNSPVRYNMELSRQRRGSGKSEFAEENDIYSDRQVSCYSSPLWILPHDHLTKKWQPVVWYFNSTALC